MTLILCSATIWINLTLEPWNNHDRKVYKRAVFVCGNDPRYADTPCVGSLTKTEPKTYQVICSPTIENRRNFKY